MTGGWVHRTREVIEVTLREEGRLPIWSIQQYLRTVHQLKLSVGAIVDAIRRVARKAQRTVDETLERIRGSPVAHADETGWGEDGVSGYVWTPDRSGGQAIQPACCRQARRRSGTSCVAVVTRGWWTRCWVSPPVRPRAGFSTVCWRANCCHCADPSQTTRWRLKTSSAGA